MKINMMIAVLVGSLVGSNTFADFKPYINKAEFDKDLYSGATIVLDFHADWCATCKKQEPLLKEILAGKGYEKVIAIKADFDKETELKKAQNVSKQSTIIVFKNSEEVVRKSGLTQKEDLKKLIDEGL